VTIERRRTDAGAVSLHYAEVDSPHPPMVLLHGIGMDWRVWQALSRRLESQFHLFMVDLRGHGTSDKPESGYGLSDYAGDIENLMERLDLRDVTLVGSSLGALVAVAVEASAETVSRRVLVDPPLGSVRARSTLFEEILRIKCSPDSPSDQQARIFDALRMNDKRAGNLILKYMAETWSMAAPGVIIEALNPSDTVEEIEMALEAIDVPTLIMRGNEARGSVLSADAAQRATSLLRRGREVYFAGAGHAIHGDQPAEFVATLQNFAMPALAAPAGPRE
jgi:pimeloyl-ACP methyl ester carboxylesterase